MKPIWLDCGNYTVIPSDDQVKALAAVGVSGAIVGTSFGVVAPAQLAAFERNGWPTEEYQFPERPKLTARKWWIDAETPTATKDSIRLALSKAGCRGIYTRSGWFAENLDGWDVKDEFPNAELWDARYIGTVHHGTPRDPCLIVAALNGRGDVAGAIRAEEAKTPPFRPYGGFTAPAITQFHNSVTIYGVNLDLNTIEAEAPPEEDEMMRQFLAWDLGRGRWYFVGPGGAQWVTRESTLQDLEADFGPLERKALTTPVVQAFGGD